MSGRYAQNTSVSVGKTKAEIEDLLTKYGADGFLSGFDNDRAFLGFRLRDPRRCIIGESALRSSMTHPTQKEAR